MPVTYINTTSLTAALDNLTKTVAVSSTANFTVGQYIVVGQEMMLVQIITNSTVAQVERGQGGTLVVTHKNGTKVYGSSATAFGPAMDVQPGLRAVTLVGAPATGLPIYRLPLGSRCVDEQGGVHVLCDFTATVHSGITVAISNDGNYTAAVLTESAQGAVGVVSDQTSTSDQWGWVQVFGYTSAQLASGDSAATSAYVAICASSVSTPNTGLDAVARTSSDLYQVWNMFVVGVATTDVTSATSHTGVAVPVFLNFPYVLGYKTNVIAPTT